MGSSCSIHPVKSYFSDGILVLVQESDQGPGRFGRIPPVGRDVPILQPFATECGVVIQILPQRGFFQSNTSNRPAPADPGSCPSSPKIPCRTKNTTPTSGLQPGS